MSEDWFEVAYINFDEAILHGNTADRSVRVVLSDEQKRAVENLNERHRDEMQRLLRGMAA